MRRPSELGAAAVAIIGVSILYILLIMAALVLGCRPNHSGVCEGPPVYFGGQTPADFLPVDDRPHITL